MTFLGVSARQGLSFQQAPTDRIDARAAQIVEGVLAWMTGAYFAGRDYKQQMIRLNKAAQDHGWQHQEYPGSQIICLRASQGPFNDEEDIMVMAKTV